MQKCKKCNSKLGYKIKLRSLSFNYSPIICDGCGCKYCVRFSTRIIFACSMLLPLFFINYFLNTLDNGNQSYLFGSYMIWIPLAFLVMPLWARYYVKDDGNGE